MAVLLLIHSDHADGSTAIVDSSPSARTITRAGGVRHETDQAKFGASSLYFDGSGDYLSVPSSADFNFGTGAFSVDFWLYVTAITDYDVICGRLDSWGHSGQFVIRLHPGVAGVEALFGAEWTQIPSLPLNTWNHIAFVRRDGFGILYLNGTPGTLTATSADITATTPFYIGHNPANSAEQLSGYLDEFRVSNTPGWSPFYPFTPWTEAYYPAPLVAAGRFAVVTSAIAHGTSPEDAYAAWATELGVSPTTSLQVLDGSYDSFVVDLAAAAFLGGPTKAMFSTSAAVGVYRAALSDTSSDWYLNNGADLGAITIMYGQTSRPSLLLSFHPGSVDLESFDAKIQRAGSTTIIYSKWGQEGSNSLNRYTAAVKITPSRIEAIGAAPTDAAAVYLTELLERTGTDMAWQTQLASQPAGSTWRYTVDITWPSGSAVLPAMFGAAVSTGLVRPVGLATLPAMLGAPTGKGLHDFSGLVGDLASRYVMDLTTPGGTVRVPISSWQATLQTDAQCYVQCVVPACAAWAEDIAAATAFTIMRRAELAGGGVIEYEMASAPVEQADFAQGPTNFTCTLSGYSPALAADEAPPAAYDRTLQAVRSINSGTSGIRVRCAIDWLLRPGHRAYVGATSFVVSYANYYVTSSGDQYMDVGERV